MFLPSTTPSCLSSMLNNISLMLIINDLNEIIKMIKSDLMSIKN